MKDTDIIFTNKTLICLGIEALLMVLAAVVFFLILRRKVKINIKALVIGAAVFPVFALMLKIIPLYPLMIAENSVSKAVNSSIWLTMLVAGLSAGIFEETGRFIAFKTVLKDCRSREDSLSYGLGHGGFEAVYIAIQVASIIIMGLTIRYNGIGAVLKDLPEDVMKTAVDQISSYSKVTPSYAALAVLERVSSLTLQIALSIMVFAAARQKGRLWLYPLAVLLHSAIDFFAVLYQQKMISMPAVELIILSYSVLTTFAAYKLLYKKTNNKEV